MVFQLRFILYEKAHIRGIIGEIIASPRWRLCVNEHMFVASQEMPTQAPRGALQAAAAPGTVKWALVQRGCPASAVQWRLDGPAFLTDDIAIHAPVRHGARAGCLLSYSHTLKTRLSWTLP